MAQTVAPPPAAVRPRATNVGVPPAPVRPAPVPAAPPAEEEKPSQPKINPVELTLFLRQVVLVVSAIAAISSAAAARYGQRTWLMAVLCAAVAAIVAGMLGMAIARSFEVQCLAMQNESK